MFISTFDTYTQPTPLISFHFLQILSCPRILSCNPNYELSRISRVFVFVYRITIFTPLRRPCVFFSYGFLRKIFWFFFHAVLSWTRLSYVSEPRKNSNVYHQCQDPIILMYIVSMSLLSCVCVLHHISILSQHLTWFYPSTIVFLASSPLSISHVKPSILNDITFFFLLLSNYVAHGRSLSHGDARPYAIRTRIFYCTMVDCIRESRKFLHFRVPIQNRK